MRDQRTLFDLTQDGLVIGKKIQRIYPEFDVSAFVSDVRAKMEGQTIYNVTKSIGRGLRQYLPEDYSDALVILMEFAEIEAPSEPTRHPTAEVETSLRPIAHFVSLYGLADFDASLDAFRALSKHRCTRGGEIREFIIKDSNRCFERFSEWVNDDKCKPSSVRGGITLHTRHKAEMAPSLYPRSTTDLGTSGNT